MSGGAPRDGKLTLPPTSKAANAALYWKHWPCGATPKAAVMIAHGYAEHLGRYEHVAAALNKAGYDVFAVDHYGHGRSDGPRAFVPAFSVLHDGLDALLQTVKAALPKAPRVLLGHSMGGLVAATYLIARQNEFAAAILSGPVIKPTEEPSAALLAVSKILSALTPKLGVAALDGTLVSRDPNVVAAYLADPLVTKGKIVARTGAELFAAMTSIASGASAITIPILIMHGGKDGLSSVEGSRILHDQAGSPDKTLKIYDGLYHEIFNEPEGPAVIADMIAWLDSHAS